MKCQILFSGKNKKTVINLSSAELARRMIKVKYPVFCLAQNKANAKMCLMPPYAKAHLHVGYNAHPS